MRGISEKVLYRFNDEAFCPRGSSSRALLEQLLSQCTELNPWLPIDENTPRDRLLQLGRLDGFQCVGRYIPQFGHWADQNQAYVEVTHYQELPDDPKE